MAPKQHRRPLNPPRYHSTDAVPTRATTTAPLPRSHSPTPSLSSQRSSSSARKPVPAYDAPPLPTTRPIPTPNNPNPFAAAAAPAATTTLGKAATTSSSPPDDFGTLNFGRRPSAIDPLAPTATGAAYGTSARQLVAGGLPSPTRASHAAAAAQAASAAQAAARTAPPPLRSAPPSYINTSSSSHSSSHARRPSHSRQPSISLSSPGTSPLPSPSYNSGAPSPTAGKILPLQPVPTRTRAPMEAFASVDMLQGQREHQDRTRGSEVFGRDGRYEGRASLSNASGEAGLSHLRRQDPTEHVRTARGSNRMTGGAPSLPPIEVDVASIATQLREHDSNRRDSEDRRGSERRFSESTDEEHSPGGNTYNIDFKATKHFSFPPNRQSKDSGAAPAYSPSENDSEDITGPYLSEKSVFADVHSSKERLTPAAGGGGGGGWRTEHLGNSDKAYQMQRPSIVALPVYPSPSGSLGRSWKVKGKRFAVKLSWITVLISATTTWYYLSLRYEAMKVVNDKMPGVFVGGWAFLVLESVVAAIMTISSLWTVFSHRQTGADPKMRLRGDANLPAVDIFIVSSGQSDQTTFDCAVAAASMDYPPHRYRVMVLDPSGSLNLQREIARHAKSQACPHLSYHRRALGGGQAQADLFHSKANSINFGMKEASSFGIKGPAEFIAVFDADMIPERNYLRAVLPTILGEGKVALVKTGHGFINLPHRLTQHSSTLYTATESISDSRSGFLLRRAALAEIGGFPADSWIQDGQCEALLAGRGYHTVVMDEVLQWGMARPTYGAQVHAMMVNRLGPLRTAGRLGFFLGGDEIKMMGYGLRIKAIGRALLPIFSILLMLLAALYPFMFSYGGILVLTPNLDNLNQLLIAALAMLVAARLHELIWCWLTGLSSPRRALQSWMFAAPYQGMSLLRLILPARLGGYTRGSDININVVAAPARPSFIKRLGWLLIDPHTGVVASFLASIGVGIWRVVRDYEHGTVDDHQTALTVLLTFAWPSLLWLEFFFASLVPFTNLLFPSRLLTEPRESFLIRDHYSSVARPKHTFKTVAPFKTHRAAEFLVGFVLIAYAVAAVALCQYTKVFA